MVRPLVRGSRLTVRPQRELDPSRCGASDKKDLKAHEFVNPALVVIQK